MTDWSEDEHVDPPADIAGIMAYSMEGGTVPEGVTVSGGEDISSRRIEDVRVREPEGEWEAL
jgi:hypothetical protein